MDVEKKIRISQYPSLSLFARTHAHAHAHAHAIMTDALNVILNKLQDIESRITRVENNSSHTHENKQSLPPPPPVAESGSSDDDITSDPDSDDNDDTGYVAMPKHLVGKAEIDMTDREKVDLARYYMLNKINSDKKATIRQARKHLRKSHSVKNRLDRGGTTGNPSSAGKVVEIGDDGLPVVAATTNTTQEEEPVPDNTTIAKMTGTPFVPDPNYADSILEQCRGDVKEHQKEIADTIERLTKERDEPKKAIPVNDPRFPDDADESKLPKPNVYSGKQVGVDLSKLKVHIPKKKAHRYLLFVCTIPRDHKAKEVYRLKDDQYLGIMHFGAYATEVRPRVWPITWSPRPT